MTTSRLSSLCCASYSFRVMLTACVFLYGINLTNQLVMGPDQQDFEGIASSFQPPTPQEKKPKRKVLEAMQQTAAKWRTWSVSYTHLTLPTIAKV